MEANLKLSNEKSAFDINKCIICQNGKDLISTENGRSKIMEAASIRKDLVAERLKSLDMHKTFYYHMNNAFYKMYTMKKTLEKLKVRTTRIIFCLLNLAQYGTMHVEI